MKEMEVIKIRVRPKNHDKKLHTLFFLTPAFLNPFDEIESKLTSLFPYGYYFDKDKVERWLIDYEIDFSGLFSEKVSHHYLDKYKEKPIQSDSDGRK